MKSRSTLTEPELSRPLLVDKISAGGIEEKIIADGEERQKLAERFGLIDLKKLEATLTVSPARGGCMYAVKGRMDAEVVQQCVVTLESLPATIEQPIDVLYVAPELLEDTDKNPNIEVETEETEPIVNGIIDLGELVAQNLGIALDPYPRKPGTAFGERVYGDPGTPENPFAKLAELKTKKPKK